MVRSTRSSNSLRMAAVVAAGVWLAAAGPSRADAIDGDWCFGTLTLNIRGPNIRTPGGTAMTGEYGRHDFHYVVPANEPGAGTEVDMRLMGEELMILTRKTGGAAQTPENWRRCRPTS